MKTTLLFIALLLVVDIVAQVEGPTPDQQIHTVCNMFAPHPDGKSKGIQVLGNLVEGIWLPRKNENFPMAFTPIQLYDSIYFWTWDTAFELWKVNAKHIDILYDAFYNQIRFTKQTWTGMTWENQSQFHYSYDGHNNLTSNIRMDWTSQQWVVAAQSISGYDDHDNLLDQVNQEWNGTSWDNTARYQYAYDTLDNLLRLETSTWIAGQWERISRYMITYDTLGNITSSLYQTWYETDWKNESLLVHTYDELNIRTRSINHIWNFNFWEESYQNLYTYDASFNLLQRLGQRWQNNSWQNADRFLLTYDDYGKNTASVIEFWTIDTWVPFLQFLSTFDEDHFLTSTSTRQYSFDGTDVISGDSTHIYFHTATSLEAAIQSVEDLTVYPNPGNGKINVTCTEVIRGIEIYNIMGERIYAATPADEASFREIDLSRYGPGTFIVALYNGSKVFTRKIIMQ